LIALTPTGRGHMEKNEKKDETSITLDPKSQSFLNNAQRVRAMGGHCPPKSPDAHRSDIPDNEL
jgi:hypothetical protein